MSNECITFFAAALMGAACFVAGTTLFLFLVLDGVTGSAILLGFGTVVLVMAFAVTRFLRGERLP